MDEERGEDTGYWSVVAFSIAFYPNSVVVVVSALSDSLTGYIARSRNCAAIKCAASILHRYPPWWRHCCCCCCYQDRRLSVATLSIDTRHRETIDVYAFTLVVALT